MPEDRLLALKELRDILAANIVACESPRDLAALSRQYRETLREIAELEGGEDAGDEIAAIINGNR